MTHRITEDAHAIRMLMLRHFTNHICALLDDVTRREYAHERFTWHIVRRADEARVTVTAVAQDSGDILEAEGSLHDESGYGAITVAVTTQCIVPVDSSDGDADSADTGAGEELVRQTRAQVHVTNVDLASLDDALYDAYTQASRASRACARRGRKACNIQAQTQTQTH